MARSLRFDLRSSLTRNLKTEETDRLLPNSIDLKKLNLRPALFSSALVRGTTPAYKRLDTEDKPSLPGRCRCSLWAAVCCLLFVLSAATVVSVVRSNESDAPTLSKPRSVVSKPHVSFRKPIVPRRSQPQQNYPVLVVNEFVDTASGELEVPVIRTS